MIEYTVETIINRIQNACAKNDVTINKMGIESGAGKSAVDNIKKGSTPLASRIFQNRVMPQKPRYYAIFIILRFKNIRNNSVYI